MWAYICVDTRERDKETNTEHVETSRDLTQVRVVRKTSWKAGQEERERKSWPKTKNKQLDWD